MIKKVTTQFKIMSKKDLVILAGGKGTRIRGLLGNKPKPMAKFNGKYLLQYIIQNFSKYNFKKIFIITKYKSGIIYKNFNGKIYNFIKVKCLREKYAMGTGGALHTIKNKKINDFVLINGDTVFDIDLKLLFKSLKNKTLGSVALVKNKNNDKNKKLNNLITKNGILDIEKDTKIMNGGIYFFKKRFLNFIRNKPMSLEEQIIPKLIEEKKISGKLFENFFLDIGTPKRFKNAKKLLLNHFKKPAVFLDRDGVINYDYGYVHKINKFKFKKGVLKGLKFLLKKNYYIFIITNQAGIAKNKFKESDFVNLHLNIKNKLEKKGIYFNEVSYSPYHPQAKLKKYKKNSLTRKPGNLLIKNIFKKWDIKRNKSFMIGDQMSDKLAAKKSGLYFEFAKNNFSKQIKLILKKINSY